MADIFAYGAKLKFLGKEKDLNNYEEILLKILKNKLFAIHPKTGKKKREYYSKIDSCLLLPKK